MHSYFRGTCLAILALSFSAAISSAQRGGGSSAATSETGLKLLNANVVRVVYPYDLAMAGTDATVEVAYQVDKDGAPINATVVQASNQDAAAAFLAALDEMQFETAMSGGETVVSQRQTLSVSIKNVQKPGDLEFVELVKKPGTVISGVREIDGSLRPLGPLPPAIFPSSLLNGPVKEGQAVLEFYIDQNGIVRLPKVVSATNAAMGWSAASAILTWRFAPPLKGGSPAIVKVTGLPIPFKAPAVQTAAAGTISSTSGLKAEVYVEAPTIANAQVRVNSTIVGLAPVRILVEVAADGVVEKQIDVSIRNPNPTAIDSITLKAGEPAPARITFNNADVATQGTAVIKR